VSLSGNANSIGCGVSFFLDRYAYNLTSKRWSSLNIQRKKKKGGTRKKRQTAALATTTSPVRDESMQSASESENEADEHDVVAAVDAMEIVSIARIDHLGSSESNPADVRAGRGQTANSTRTEIRG
jgi:hypothetical protein